MHTFGSSSGSMNYYLWWVKISVHTSSSSSSLSFALRFSFKQFFRFGFYLLIIFFYSLFRFIHISMYPEEPFISATIYLINTITWLSHFLIAAHAPLFIYHRFIYVYVCKHLVDFNRSMAAQRHMNEWLQLPGDLSCCTHQFTSN